jgi:hypothetical protein
MVRSTFYIFGAEAGFNKSLVCWFSWMKMTRLYWTLIAIERVRPWMGHTMILADQKKWRGHLSIFVDVRRLACNGPFHRSNVRFVKSNIRHHNVVMIDYMYSKNSLARARKITQGSLVRQKFRFGPHKDSSSFRLFEFRSTFGTIIKMMLSGTSIPTAQRWKRAKICFLEFVGASPPAFFATKLWTKRSRSPPNEGLSSCEVILVRLKSVMV